MSPTLTRARGPNPSSGAAYLEKRASRSAQRTRSRSATSVRTLDEMTVAALTSQNESTMMASRKLRSTRKTMSSYDQKPSCPTELCTQQQSPVWSPSPRRKLAGSWRQAHHEARERAQLVIDGHVAHDDLQAGDDAVAKARKALDGGAKDEVSHHGIPQKHHATDEQKVQQIGQRHHERPCDLNAHAFVSCHPDVVRRVAQALLSEGRTTPRRG